MNDIKKRIQELKKMDYYINNLELDYSDFYMWYSVFIESATQQDFEDMANDNEIYELITKVYNEIKAHYN